MELWYRFCRNLLRNSHCLIIHFHLIIISTSNLASVLKCSNRKCQYQVLQSAYPCTYIANVQALTTYFSEIMAFHSLHYIFEKNITFRNLAIHSCHVHVVATKSKCWRITYWPLCVLLRPDSVCIVYKNEKKNVVWLFEINFFCVLIIILLHFLS